MQKNNAFSHFKGSNRDDMGTVSIEFWCGSSDNRVSEFHDKWLNWIYPADERKFSKWKRCPRDKVICGIRTQVEAHKDDLDDTGLNGVIFKCCFK